MNIRAILVLIFLLPLMGTPAVVYADNQGVVSTASKLISPETARSDLTFLYENLQEAHFNLYAHRSKAEYDAYYLTLMASLHSPMDYVDVAKSFQKFVAYGRIGHARIDAPIIAFVTYLQDGGTLLPLFIRVDGGRVLLTETAESSGTLRAETEITAINGIPIHEVLNRVGTYVSAERPYMLYAQMEESFPALLWLEYGAQANVMVTAKVAGQLVTVPVQGLTLDQRRELNKTFPSPKLATDFSIREYKALDDRIAYLRPGPFYNTDNTTKNAEPSYQASSFLAFIDNSFGAMLASGSTDLIVDLRNNPGGDNSFSDPMVAWFASCPFRFASSFHMKASAATKADYARQRAETGAIDPEFQQQMDIEARQPNGTRYSYNLPFVRPHTPPRFQGRVWVLINRHSYSNSASVAALIQDYGFGKLIGEETADVASNYASVQSFTLPGTKIMVTYPKSHFVRPNGKDEVMGVQPDILVPRPPVGATKDIVLNTALSIIRTDRLTRTP